MTISEEKYREICDSDEEFDGNSSNIDFQGLSDPEDNDFDLREAEMDDQENNKQYDYEMLWSDELSNFSRQTESAGEVG